MPLMVLFALSMAFFMVCRKQYHDICSDTMSGRGVRAWHLDFLPERTSNPTTEGSVGSRRPTVHQPEASADFSDVAFSALSPMV